MLPINFSYRSDSATVRYMAASLYEPLGNWERNARIRQARAVLMTVERQAGAGIGTKATSRNVTIWPLSMEERENEAGSANRPRLIQLAVRNQPRWRAALLATRDFEEH
jgi:hypothetical protein